VTHPLIAMAIIVLGAFTPTAPTSFMPPRGSVAPVVNLRSMTGEMVSTAALAPRPLILIFGEPDHERTQEACTAVLDGLGDPRFEGATIIPILILAQDAPKTPPIGPAAQARIPAVVLNDPKRESFEAYHVIAVPSCVVIDGRGVIVHCLPGFLNNAKSAVVEASLHAVGKQSIEQLDRALDPSAGKASAEQARADRLVHLGVELIRHHLYDLAEARLTEANTLVQGHVGAALALGELWLRRDRLDDAERAFRSALASHPESHEAILGLVAVRIDRGKELAQAEADVQRLLKQSPNHPKARYLLGRLLEARGDPAAAASEYRKAAELLIDR
jgi:Tetratricopeptide repeat